MDNPTIMTPANPNWSEFCKQLEDAIELDGCRSHEGTKRILKTIPGIDADASMLFFEDHGGCCCECEVLMNVENVFMRRREQEYIH